jgi:Undecaprenyl-phosphate galactose phosphotransferase WbaP
MALPREMTSSNNRAMRGLAATVSLTIVVSTIFVLGAWVFLSTLWSYPWILVPILIVAVLVAFFSVRTSFIELFRDDLDGDKVSTEQQKEMQVPQDEAALVAVARTKSWSQVWTQCLVVLVLVMSDALLAVLAWLVVYDLQNISGSWQGFFSSARAVQTATEVGVFVAVWIGLRSLMRLYPGYGLSSAERLRRHTYSVLATLAIVAVYVAGFQVEHLLSQATVIMVFLGLLLLSPLGQHLAKLRMKKIGLWGRPVIILGYKDTGGQFLELLQREWELGYSPVALFGCNLAPSRMASQEIPREETLADAVDLGRERGVDTVIFAMPYIRREQLAPLASQASLSFRHVLVTPNLIGITNSAVVAGDLAGTLAVEVKYNLLNSWALRAKRVLDLVVTVVGGVLVAPLLLVVAVLIYMESGPPIFYKDLRIGQNGTLFRGIKFRTLAPGAETLLLRTLKENAVSKEEYAKYYKPHHDPRITRVGWFLRRTSLDELPQLWNVLRGEMSLVGPHPYLLRESKEIGTSQSEILRVAPGLTGPLQVAWPSEISYGERSQIEAQYVRNWSVWLDLIILARTVKIVLLGRAAVPMQTIFDTDVQEVVATFRGREEKEEEEIEATIEELERLWAMSSER